MKYIKMTFLVGLIAVSLIAIGVVGSAVPALDKVVNVTTGEEYHGQDCIQEAVNEANSGDIIVVYNPEEGAGAYGEKVDITEQLTLKAEDLSDKPIILGGSSQDLGEWYGIAAHGSNPLENPEDAPDNVVINGFRVKHETAYSNSKGIWLIGSDEGTVKNNEVIKGWTEGIMLEEADNNTVKNNKIGIYSSDNGEEIAEGNKTGILLLNSDNNTIGPGNVVKYNGTGLKIIDSDNTTIKDSVFNYNLDEGGFLHPVNEVENLTIEGSEFNENGEVGSISYGLLSRAKIDGMEVVGSEFNSNNATGMAFNPSEEIYLVYEPAFETPPSASVNDLSIEDSSFNNNVYFGDFFQWGFGLTSSVDTSNMEVTNSTFNNNFDAGIYFGPPPRNPQNISLPLNTIENLTIEGSEFNENGRVTGEEDGSSRPSYGLVSRAKIDGMEVVGSEFNSNNGTGMGFFPSGEYGETPPPASVNDLSIEDSSFNNNVYYDGQMEPVSGFGLTSSVDTSNMEVTNSTFNNNFDAGMYFGPPPRETSYPLNTTEDLTIKNSHFDSNDLSENPPEGSGFLSYSHINKMTVKGSTFDENAFAGMLIGNLDSTEIIPNVSDVSISGSSFTGNGVLGLITSANLNGMEVSQTEVKGNAYGLFFQGSPEASVEDISIHHSSISDNTKSLPDGIEFLPFNNAGLINYTDTTINAAINWWDSATGPSVDLDYQEGDKFKPQYEGGGDKILGAVAFAPWLGEDPDKNPDKPGVQLIDPLPIIVRKVGPVPTTKTGNTGYLDMAIWGASSVPVRGQIIVSHGSYEAREALGNAELISVNGTTCHTCLEDVENSKLTVNEDNTVIGQLDGDTPRGFIIKDEVRIKSGVNASTVHLNWNDIRKTVENNGYARLDAEYNWWGDLDPSDSVKGNVDYRPFLPEDPCSFANYMKEHGLTDPREAVVNRMSEGDTCSTDLPKQMIVNYRLKPRQAENLVDKHGCYDIREAMEKADDDFATFKEVLSSI